MKWTVTTPPERFPVTWTQACAHLRLNDGAESQQVRLMIAAATDYAEERMETSLVPRTITAVFYAGEPLHLPRGPLIEVLSVTDNQDNAITDYDVTRVGHSDRLVVNTSFVAPLTVVYRAGYGSSIEAPDPASTPQRADDPIPSSVQLAILQHVSTLFENRESVSERGRSVVPHSLEAFYAMRSRNVGIG